ncbi:MAG: hypothetical protein Q9184_006486 [Pyrenodesmia sp. 2 TL-2023]
MSRNDTYLSLCLEQASLSTLHYRHGCIVVRGGKVIGKGFNDYRPGFNGGAQMNGRLRSAAASSSIAITCRKSKNSKYHDAPSDSSDPASASTTKPKTYVAFDSRDHALGTGGGTLANTPLSMHSEMMAINSALSLSSAIACRGTARSTQWLQKPCYKLSSRTKRRNRLQHLKAYADAICRASEEQTTTSERRGGSYHYQNDYYNAEEEKEEEKKKKKANVLKCCNQDNNHVHHHAQTNHQAFQEAKSQKVWQPTSDGNEKQRKQYLYGLPNVSQGNHQSRHQEDQRSIQSHPQQRHRQQQQQQRQQQQHKSAAAVVPQHRIATKAHQIAERMKDSRLNGADLYVARLGKAAKVNHHDCGCRLDETSASTVDGAAVLETDGQQRASDPGVFSKMKPLTGSLHEELRFQSHAEEGKPRPQSVHPETQPTATHSRPCYRCISYMHSAGIKRVFWTNYKGEWEGGKVRDLVDALECPSSPNGNSSTGQCAAGSVYVTKSEVLLLKGLK